MSNCSDKIFSPIGTNCVMWVMAIFMPPVVIFGLLGNSLSFIILKDSSRKVSSFFYIRCLTIFDSLSLILTMLGFYMTLVIHPMLISNERYRNISYIINQWGTCQTKTYLAFSCRTMSIWTIVVFTLERLVCVKFPIISMKVCTIRNAKITVVILVIVSLLSSIDWIFSFEKVLCKKYNLYVCKPKQNMLKFRILEMLMLSVVPALIIIVSNIIIVLTLRQRRRLSLVAYEEPKNKKRDNKITIQLLAVSTTFTLLTIPQCISVIINTRHEQLKLTDNRQGHLANFYHLTFLLFTLNFAINFVLYCFIGHNFRNAALNIILCRFRQMRQLRRAIFETVSNDTRHTTVSKLSTKRNSQIYNSDHKYIPNNDLPKEKFPPLIENESYI
uniref:GCR104 n=1 Tax=Schmidtea mediterranea TaxID=79327 RepID=A0A193KUB9_SCHMD|nr:GCR104 [Schmidtea mediterranea]